MAGTRSVQRLSSSSSPKIREARPDEVNYALRQNMGEGFTRKSIKICALGTTYDMVYGEWTVQGRNGVDSPAVVCIHGTPATDGAFRPIGSLIAARGYRVLSVNFPGMGYTQIDPEKRYNFSVPHKAQLVKAFISKLQLQRVAMVMGHSLGCQVVGRVVADPELEGVVQSACFVCGTGIVPHKLYKNFQRMLILPYQSYLMYKAMYLPVVGWFITQVLSFILHHMGFRGKTPESQALSYYEASQMNFDMFGKDMAKSAARHLPVLLFYSIDDSVVESELMTANIEVLGIPDQDIKEYNENGHSDHTFHANTLRRVVRFVSGTHRLQFTNPHQTAGEIVSLLDAICSRNDTVT